MLCTIPNCSEIAAGDTTPPLCPVHLDLDILVGFIEARRVEVTSETVSRYLALGQSHSAEWQLQPDQIATLLPGLLAARYPHLTKKEPAIATPAIAGQIVTPAGVNQ